jgi:demethylmenaquinone methyltransferase/2-methoxy-6-polyprenyl-1,4-benzoquinol methylase
MSAPALRPPPRSAAWDRAALRNPHSAPDKAARVERMFDAVAPRYERVNAVASLGRDAAWRRRAVASAQVNSGDVVLDLCCGTGDMLRAFDAGPTRPGRLIGLDFSAEMLRHGAYPHLAAPLTLIRADAQRLPLADASVDVISCAFGVRNLADLGAGLREAGRVARPGARIVILEFATPRNPVLRWAYQNYCEHMLPLLAAWVSTERVGAYRYLARSIRTFETVESMLRRLRDAGFERAVAAFMHLGGVVLYRGVRE